MITTFGSLYAGHVDLEDIGFDGTPVNDRWLTDEHLATVFEKSEAIATLMDRLGYDVLWAAEHRFQREGYECIPNLLILFMHLAHITTRLKFGCGFNVTPMWHPLRLAEDFAMVDHLTNGRVIFGVGRGYHARSAKRWVPRAPPWMTKGIVISLKNKSRSFSKPSTTGRFRITASAMTSPPACRIVAIRCQKFRWSRVRDISLSNAGSLS